MEALWRILWEKFLSWVDENRKVISDGIKLCATDIMTAFTEHDLSKAEVAYNKLTNLNRDVIVLFKEFEKDYADQPNFKYWMDYMELVSILLNFTRAKREGNWELYLVSFSSMLPWFAVYNHTNYSRWGPIYLADMYQLPTTAPEIHRSFVLGKFSVKRTNKKFSTRYQK